MNYLDFLNNNYPVRRTVKEKEAFRAAILEHLTGRGIDARVEKTSDGKNENVVIGDVSTAKVVCTAHYDTPAASLFPNLMIPRSPLFYLYQFAPVILMLAASLGGGYLLADAVYHGGDTTEFMRVYILVYLVIYYGLFFLMYRAFKNPNNYNDNTSGVATVLTVLENLSEDERKKFAFILFDNEEKGKKGSKAYAKDHKDMMKERLVVNFDCVGDGEHIIFIAMKDAEKREEYRKLCESFADSGAYSTYFYPIKGSQSNSDYKNFPCGVGCMACRKSRRGVFYTPNIHTPKDTVANTENICFLSDGMKRFAKTL